MPHLPEHVIARLRLRLRLRPVIRTEPEPEPEEPLYSWEVQSPGPEPVPGPAEQEEDLLARISCPDPECAAPIRVYRDDLPDHYVLPAHCTPPGWNLTVHPRCWLSGCHIKDARSIVRMREENGGRLKRAAHP